MPELEKPEDAATTEKPVDDTATSGAAEGEDEDDEKITVSKREHKAHLEKAAKYNQLEREAEELRERERLRAQDEGSATDRSRMTEEQRAARELDERIAQLEEESRPFTGSDGRQYPGNAAAWASLQALREIARQRNEDADRTYLMEATTVDDETGEERLLTPQERKEVRELRQRNPGHFGSAASALDAWEGRRARQSRKQMAEEKRKAEQVVREREREDVVRTHRRDETGGEARERHLTNAAFQSKLNKLEEAGKSDEAWKLRQDVARGRVTLSD